MKNRSSPDAGFWPATQPLIAFIGSSHYFPDRMLEVLKAEFPDFNFARMGRLSDFVALPERPRNLPFVVFDENQIAPLLADPDFYFDAVGSTQIVFAVFDTETVANFLHNRPASGELDRIGFLPLHSRMEVWMSVMRLLLCGQNFLPQELVGCLRAAAAKAEPCDLQAFHLTPRERQVLTLVADGVPNKNIAADLDLSVHTVKLHIHNLLKKIGVTNRTQAANWYIQAKDRAAPRAGYKDV